MPATRVCGSVYHGLSALDKIIARFAAKAEGEVIGRNRASAVTAAKAPQTGREKKGREMGRGQPGDHRHVGQDFANRQDGLDAFACRHDRT